MDNQRRRKGTKSLDLGRDSSITDESKNASDSVKAAAWVWHLHSSTDSNTKQQQKNQNQSDAKFITRHSRSQSVSTANVLQPSRFGVESKVKPDSDTCDSEHKQKGYGNLQKNDEIVMKDEAARGKKSHRKTVTWSNILGDDMIQQRASSKLDGYGNDMPHQKSGDEMKPKTVKKKKNDGLPNGLFRKEIENKNDGGLNRESVMKNSEDLTDVKKETAKKTINVSNDGKVSDTVWDCGSILYDTFELVSFSDRLDRSLLALPEFDRDDCNQNEGDDQHINPSYSHGDYSSLHQSPTLLRTHSLPRSSSSGNLSKSAGFVSTLPLDQTPEKSDFADPKPKSKFQIISKLAKFFRKKTSRSKSINPSHGKDQTWSALYSDYTANRNGDMDNYRINSTANSNGDIGNCKINSDKMKIFHMPSEDEKSYTVNYEDRLATIPESPQKLHYHHIHHHHHHYVLKPPLFPNNFDSNGYQEKPKQQFPIIVDAHITSFRPRSESARLSPYTMAKLCTEQNWI